MKRQKQMINLVFLGGIHGVGKTTFCKPVAEATGYSHVTASQLIREKNAAAISVDSKIVKDADYNQKLLIEAVKERLKAGEKFLLDGHFTIQTAHGILKLEASVFKSLGVQEIVILADDPDKIAQRIEGRDGKKMSDTDLALHQNLEIEAAEAVAHNLDIHFQKLTPGPESVELLIRRLKD